MIYNKKINDIKSVLGMDLERYQLCKKDIDLRIPYDYAEELYNLLDRIETLRVKHFIPMHTMIDQSDQELINWLKGHMANGMVDMLLKERFVRFYTGKRPFGDVDSSNGEPGAIYEAELLVIKPMDKKEYGE